MLTNRLVDSFCQNIYIYMSEAMNENKYVGFGGSPQANYSFHEKCKQMQCIVMQKRSRLPRINKLSYWKHWKKSYHIMYFRASLGYSIILS